jgi:hypothetical protein
MTSVLEARLVVSADVEPVVVDVVDGQGAVVVVPVVAGVVVVFVVVVVVEVVEVVAGLVVVVRAVVVGRSVVGTTVSVREGPVAVTG